MKILSSNNYYQPSFQRYFKDKNEKLKQFELNRNKSLDYLDIDKAFVEYLYQTRAKAITRNIPKDIRKNFSMINYDKTGDITKYNTFNYPRLYRGIGITEVKKLFEGEQIYSRQRSHQYGVDTTNHPGGIGYGEYLVTFKLKPNLDHYLSNLYASQFAENNMPHIEGRGSGNTGTSYHSILTNTYTINDVEEIRSLETDEIIYSSKDEKIPDYNQLIKKLQSDKPEEVIESIEKLQTYHSGYGEFLEKLHFLKNSNNIDVLDAYFNAIYNYGHKEDLSLIEDYICNNEKIDNQIIARLANCIEKFGNVGECDEVIYILAEKLNSNPHNNNTEYAYKNLKDAMEKIKFDHKNKANNLKEFLLYPNAFMQSVAISLLGNSPFADVETDAKISSIKASSKADKNEMLRTSIATYETFAKFFRKKDFSITEAKSNKPKPHILPGIWDELLL